MRNMARILLVDDEKAVREPLRIKLERAGHEVMEAGNGNEADELLAQNSFELVITDIIMPKKEGLELIRDLKKNFPNVKIIAITGGDRQINQKLNLESALQLGADDMLQKPFTLSTLLRSVKICLSGTVRATLLEESN